MYSCFQIFGTTRAKSCILLIGASSFLWIATMLFISCKQSTIRTSIVHSRWELGTIGKFLFLIICLEPESLSWADIILSTVASNGQMRLLEQRCKKCYAIVIQFIFRFQNRHLRKVQYPSKQWCSNSWSRLSGRVSRLNPSVWTLATDEQLIFLEIWLRLLGLFS